MLCVFLIHKEIINQRATITIEVLIQFYENREVHTAYNNNEITFRIIIIINITADS